MATATQQRKLPCLSTVQTCWIPRRRQPCCTSPFQLAARFKNLQARATTEEADSSIGEPRTCLGHFGFFCFPLRLALLPSVHPPCDSKTESLACDTYLVFFTESGPPQRRKDDYVASGGRRGFLAAAAAPLFLAAAPQVSLTKSNY
jgi:hypothetical protein